MRRYEFPDFGRIMEEIFDAAEDVTCAFTDSMRFQPKDGAWRWKGEFYPSYSYPPSNIYMLPDKTLVFEFAVAGFDESDVKLEFKGEYMLFSAKATEEEKPENVHYFKRRLKVKDIPEQRYHVPADKFDRERVEAVYKNGVLRVCIPPKAEPETDEGVEIKIKKEGK